MAGAAEIDSAVKQVRGAVPDPDKMPPELFEKMNISKEEFTEVVARMKERDARTPALGTEAADFELELLSLEGKRSGELRRLSDHRGRPVALVFGSYT